MAVRIEAMVAATSSSDAGSKHGFPSQIQKHWRQRRLA
jgi:hypothetical protein